jgi:hypothetical protein
VSLRGRPERERSALQTLHGPTASDSLLCSNLAGNVCRYAKFTVSPIDVVLFSLDGFLSSLSCRAQEKHSLPSSSLRHLQYLLWCLSSAGPLVGSLASGHDQPGVLNVILGCLRWLHSVKFDEREVDVDSTSKLQASVTAHATAHSRRHMQKSARSRRLGEDTRCLCTTKTRQREHDLYAIALAAQTCA